MTDLNVGKTTKLVIPEEKIDDDYISGQEVKGGLIKRQFRKPHRRAFIVLNVEQEFQTRLLLHKANPDAVETTYYFVDPSLRDQISTELKSVRIFPYYCRMHRDFALWCLPVTIGHPWYESAAEVLRHDATFFQQNEIKIVPDQSISRYRIFHRPVQETVNWPEMDVASLAGEAIGPANIIDSPNHPFYEDLVSGSEIR